jgi:hypothetical protein
MRPAPDVCETVSIGNGSLERYQVTSKLNQFPEHFESVYLENLTLLLHEIIFNSKEFCSSKN